MSGSSTMNTKRKELMEYKNKLIRDLKYFDSRLNEARNKLAKQSSHIINDDISSDSDVDLTALIDLGPSIPELKQKQSHLKTCLQATRELAGLQVLQKQVELLVEEPEIEGDPVKEDGSWYEVVAECKMDLIPFLITFLVHKSARKFGPVHYRNLKLSAVKKAHECELAAALNLPRNPGEAVELMRKFAHAHRSRRSTLARLADTFASTIHMDPRPEGGFIIKCLDVMAMSWTVKYSSSLGDYTHSLKFDIEDIDDKYIQIIKEYYQQLGPTISTKQRTLLLEKILHTCIASKGTTLEMYESTESDQETIERHHHNQRLLNNHETANKNDIINPPVNKDKEIMAPPKAPPKKTKPKGKENKNANDQANDKAVKRPIAENNDEVANKKLKKDTKSEKLSNDQTKDSKKLSTVKTKDNLKNTNNLNANLEKPTKSKEKVNVNDVKTIKKLDKIAKKTEKESNSDAAITDTNDAQKVNQKQVKQTDKTKHKSDSANAKKPKDKVSKVTDAEKDDNIEKAKERVAIKKSYKNLVKGGKAAVMNDAAGPATEKIEKKRKKSILDRVSAIDKQFEENTAKNANVGSVRMSKSADIANEIKRSTKNADMPRQSKDVIRKSAGKDKNIRRGTFTVNTPPKKNLPTIPTQKTAIASNKLPKFGFGRNLSTASVTSNSGSRISKIPQKLSHLKPNTLRVSPRKHVQMKTKSSIPSIAKPVQKHPVTNIPRLLKKPEAKNVS